MRLSRTQAALAFASVLMATSAVAEPQGSLPTNVSPVTAPTDIRPPSKPNVLFLEPVTLSDAKMTMMYGNAIGCGDGPSHLAARLLIITDRTDAQAQNLSAEDQMRYIERARFRAQTLLRKLVPGHKPATLAQIFNDGLIQLGAEMSKESHVHTEIMAHGMDIVPIYGVCPLMRRFEHAVTWDFLKGQDARRRIRRSTPAPRPADPQV